MSIRFYFVLLLFIFLTSSTSVLLLYFYMNPIPYPVRAFTLMWIGCFLMFSSILAPLFFFVKKVYYRGDVNLTTMSASIRQAILASLWVIFLLSLWLYNISEWRIIAIGVAILLCVEVMFQAIS